MGFLLLAYHLKTHGYRRRTSRAENQLLCQEEGGSHDFENYGIERETFRDSFA